MKKIIILSLCLLCFKAYSQLSCENQLYIERLKKHACQKYYENIKKPVNYNELDFIPECQLEYDGELSVKAVLESFEKNISLRYSWEGFYDYVGIKKGNKFVAGYYGIYGFNSEFRDSFIISMIEDYNAKRIYSLMLLGTYLVYDENDEIYFFVSGVGAYLLKDVPEEIWNKYFVRVYEESRRLMESSEE